MIVIKKPAHNFFMISSYCSRTLEFSRAELRRLKVARFAKLFPAQMIIADLSFIFQKWILANCKAGD
jgi:hypothetical protein